MREGCRNPGRRIDRLCRFFLPINYDIMKAIQLLQAHRAIHSISLKLFAPFLLGFTLSCNQRNLGHAAGEISQQSETEQELNSEFKMHIDHSCSFAGELSDNSVLAFSSDQFCSL